MSRFISGVLALGMVVCSAVQAQAVMLVGNTISDTIQKYSSTGTYIGLFANLSLNGFTDPTQMDVGVGADSNTLYVNTAQGVEKYNATTGAFIGSLNSTPRQAMVVGPDGNIYTAANETKLIYQTTPAGAGNATVWHTLGSISYNGKVDTNVVGLAITNEGYLGAYMDITGPNWVAALKLADGSEQYVSSPTSSLRGESRYLQNVPGVGSGNLAYSPANMYFEQNNELAAMGGFAGDAFDDGTSPAPAFGNWVDQTVGTYGQVVYDPISGRTYYTISNGTLQVVRYALDADNVATGSGNPTPTYHSFISDDIDLDGAYGIVVLPDASAATIPEPSTIVLAAIGLAGLGLIGWRRRRGR